MMGKPLDWVDINVHGWIALAVGFCIGLFGFISWWIVLPLMGCHGAFWIGREAGQRIAKNQPMDRLWTELQVFLEWTVPNATGLIGVGMAGALVTLL